MPGIQDLLAAPQQAPQAAPQGGPQLPQGNPLAALAAQQPQAPPPPPSHAQTVAAVHHFGEIKQAMVPVMKDPNLGKSNVRPKLLDSFSKLLATKTLSLPEIMTALKSLPEDPIAQKKFVEKIYADNNQAQQMVLQQYAQSPAEQGEPDPWSEDGHAGHMSSFAQRYSGGK